MRKILEQLLFQLIPVKSLLKFGKGNKTWQKDYHSPYKGETWLRNK